MHCDFPFTRLWEYVQGGGDAPRGETETHLSRCPSCAGTVRELLREEEPDELELQASVKQGLYFLVPRSVPLFLRFRSPVAAAASVLLAAGLVALAAVGTAWWREGDRSGLAGPGGPGRGVADVYRRPAEPARSMELPHPHVPRSRKGPELPRLVTDRARSPEIGPAREEPGEVSEMPVFWKELSDRGVRWTGSRIEIPVSGQTAPFRVRTVRSSAPEGSFPAGRPEESTTLRIVLQADDTWRGSGLPVFDFD